MNKKTLIIVLAVVVAGAAAGLYFFFRGSSKHLRLIPGNAAFVATIDIKTLADKAEADGKLKETKFYKAFSKNEKTRGMSKLFAEVLKHPLNCGLNVFSKMYVFAETGNNNAFTMGSVIDVKNQDDFTKFVKGVEGVGKMVSDKKTYHLLMSNGDFMAWNEHGLLVVGAASGADGEEQEAATLKAIDRLMTQDKKLSMADNKDFSRHPGKQDIDLYLNYEQLMKLNATSGNPMISSMTQNYKGVYMTGGITFENDKISFSGKLHGDEKNIEKITYTKNKGVSDDAMKYVTNDKVQMLMSVNLDMQKLIAMFTADQGIRQNMEQTAKGMGLTLKELETIFSGELTIALADIADKTIKTYDYVLNEATGEMEMVQATAVQPMPVLTVNLGVGNKDAYNKLMKNLPVQPVEGVRTYPLMMLSSMAYHTENDYGINLTNDSAWAAALAKNKQLAGKPSAEVSKLATGNPAGFYMDLTLEHYPLSLRDYLKGMMGEKDFTDFKNFMSVFVDVQGYGGKENSSADIHLTKGEGNSLYRLLKQCDYLPLDK
jgi:hypothetical protein